MGNTAVNIGNHYDLSNEMFATFLSKDMTYSCAYWRDEHESLEQAQINKLDLLISKLKLTKEHTVLEIGFGWGSLSMRIAKTVGCKVVGLTLSREQKALAEERVAAAGLSELIEYATSCASNRLSAPRSAPRPAVRCPSPPFADLR